MQADALREAAVTPSATLSFTLDAAPSHRYVAAFGRSGNEVSVRISEVAGPVDFVK